MSRIFYALHQQNASDMGNIVWYTNESIVYQVCIGARKTY